MLDDDLPLIKDAVKVTHAQPNSGMVAYPNEEADWKSDDCVLTVSVHLLTVASRFLPMLEGPGRQGVGHQRASSRAIATLAITGPLGARSSTCQPRPHCTMVLSSYAPSFTCRIKTASSRL